MKSWKHSAMDSKADAPLPSSAIHSSVTNRGGESARSRVITVVRVVSPSIPRGMRRIIPALLSGSASTTLYFQYRLHVARSISSNQAESSNDACELPSLQTTAASWMLALPGHQHSPAFKHDQPSTEESPNSLR